MDKSSSSTLRHQSQYGYGRMLDIPFERAVERAREALMAEGFGVLSEIDVKEKFREKLGADFRKYVILGACNPPLAYQAMQEDLEVGLLLPCNVVVYEQEGRSVVSAIDATKMLSVTGRPRLEPVAAEVNKKLRRVIDTL